MDLKPSIGLMSRLSFLWSLPTMLLRYLAMRGRNGGDLLAALSALYSPSQLHRFDSCPSCEVDPKI
jgi:hypothetical protein